jgi:hypothetical protein
MRRRMRPALTRRQAAWPGQRAMAAFRQGLLSCWRSAGGAAVYVTLLISEQQLIRWLSSLPVIMSIRVLQRGSLESACHPSYLG